MAQNIRLDPERRDYVLSAAGSSIPSDSVNEASYYALTIPQGRWLYGDPNQGSALYTLQNEKRRASSEQRIAAYSVDAVYRQVVNVGKATDAVFQNRETSRVASKNDLTVTPAEIEVSSELEFTGV